MAGIKRGREGGDTLTSDGVQAAKKRRAGYSEADAALAKVYNDLADDIHEVRIKAASQLLKSLSQASPDQPQRASAALARLIRGLCSGRKAARLGFAIALAETLRLVFNSPTFDIQLGDVVRRIEECTVPERNASGQEKRDCFLGRRFAFQAILQSDVAKQQSIEDHWTAFIQAIGRLSSEKQWLRRECGLMLYEYLTGPAAAGLSHTRAQTIVETMHLQDLHRTPEGVALWLAVQEHFPNARLPSKVWHHRDPLSAHERTSLSRIMLEIGTEEEPLGPANGTVKNKKQKNGSRESVANFSWKVVLDHLYRRNEANAFPKLWKSLVADTMFTSASSTERKALGLQVFQMAVETAPIGMLSHVCSSSIIRCIIDHRADPDRYLYEASKVALNSILARVKREPAAAKDFLHALIVKGAINFDQATKTKVVDNILSSAEGEDLKAVVKLVAELISKPDTSDQSQPDTKRRMLADLLLTTVRSHKDPSQLFDRVDPQAVEGTELKSWMQELLAAFVVHGYCTFSTQEPQFTDVTRTMIRSRLMSCLSTLLSQPLHLATLAPHYALGVLSTADISPHIVAHKKTEQLLDVARSIWTEIGQKLLNVNGPAKAALRAFEILFELSILQVYSQEPDSSAALEDLITCYRTRGESGDSTTMLVELLLSFVSKPSALFRKLAEQVFATFASELTQDSLGSLLDILQQKENLSGQQELFKEEDEEDDVNNSEDDEDEVEDVEDASDVEIVNGQEVMGSDEDEDESDDDSSEGSLDGDDPVDDVEDEEAVFDRKLADALGTANVESDSDDDGSDMDDEQMMALEPHLNTIFKERQNKTNKTQEKKNAKENIVNFKNRILDLLMVYVKKQYNAVLALDLILPLTNLVRTTTSKPTAERAFAVLKQYFESCNKHKSLPSPGEADDCFNMLAAIHEEMKLGGSKLHINACSRSSLFLSKVLITLDPGNYERIASNYARLQSEWYLDPKSKIQASVFTEWTSWSIGTRKHS